MKMVKGGDGGWKSKQYNIPKQLEYVRDGEHVLTSDDRDTDWLVVNGGARHLLGEISLGRRDYDYE